MKMTPQSRIEAYMNGIINGENAVPQKPLTRKESYYDYMVKKMNGEQGTKPNVPFTREEAYLDAMAEGIGGSIESAEGVKF